MKTARRTLAIAILLVAALIGGVVAFTSFTHFFPTVPVRPAAGHAELTTFCGTSSNAPLTAFGTPTVGFRGNVAFACGLAPPSVGIPLPALNVTSVGSATMTTTGNLGPYVSLYLAPHRSIDFSSSSPCHTVDAGIILLNLSGSSLIGLNETGEYDYCAAFLTLPSGTTSLPSFQATWS